MSNPGGWPLPVCHFLHVSEAWRQYRVKCEGRLLAHWHEVLHFIRRLKKAGNKSLLRRNLRNEE